MRVPPAKFAGLEAGVFRAFGVNYIIPYPHGRPQCAAAPVRAGDVVFEAGDAGELKNVANNARSECRRVPCPESFKRETWTTHTGSEQWLRHKHCMILKNARKEPLLSGANRNFRRENGCGVGAFLAVTQTPLIGYFVSPRKMSLIDPFFPRQEPPSPVRQNVAQPPFLQQKRVAAPDPALRARDCALRKVALAGCFAQARPSSLAAKSPNLQMTIPLLPSETGQEIRPFAHF